MKKKLSKKKKLLNPGSIGQPRNKKCGASWMTLNTKNMTFKILTTKYNHKNLKKKINSIDKNNLKIAKYFNKCH